MSGIIIGLTTSFVKPKPMNDSNTLLKEFPAVLTLPILWGNMDALGHVNNTIHFGWFESSRIYYIEQAMMHSLLGGHKLGPILASTNCNYKRQLLYPGNVAIGSRVVRIGRTSMTLAHCIVNQEKNEVAATGESVVVIFNFETQRPVRMPQDVRDAIVAYQGEVDD